MPLNTINIKTSGEKFYNITSEVQNELMQHLDKRECKTKSGIVCLFLAHTSCALTVSEAFDQSAATDMENFLKNIASRKLSFITHTAEGPDDSPSHMKSILLQQSLNLIVENSEIFLGQWQGIYLAEFRDSPRTRQIHYKFIEER